MSRVVAFLVFLSMTATLSAQTAPAQGEQLYRTETIRDVVYGKGGPYALTLDIIRPVGDFPKPLPSVIWIHGGGWRQGNKDNAPTAALAARGFFTVSINYRLSHVATFPGAIEDAKCAVRWLRANAAKYNLDPDGIGAWGASAGGHLAELLAVTPNQPALEGAGGYNDQSSRVAAVVSFAGVSDFTRATEGFSRDLWPLAVAFLGGKPNEKPGVYRQASPALQVTAETAPMLLVHGDKDEIVPLQQSVLMAEVLKKAGVDHQLIVIKNADHHFRATDPNGRQPSAAEVHRAVLAWFDKHLRKK
jgi:acetyl esterase/lipase